MTKTKILLLVSKEFPLDVLNNSPRFLSYSFYSVAAIHYLGDYSNEKKNNLLLGEVCGQIKKIRPKYLIVHLGLAFTRSPIEFLETVLEIKNRFPELNIILDQSFEYIHLYLSTIRNSANEVISLRNRLAQNQSLFYLEEEEKFLLSCLR